MNNYPFKPHPRPVSARLYQIRCTRTLDVLFEAVAETAQQAYEAWRKDDLRPLTDDEQDTDSWLNDDEISIRPLAEVESDAA